MWKRQTALGALTVLALGCVAARADDTHKPQDPDPGFLEFLGSVDRLADVNPDYLSQQDPSRPPAAPPKPGAQTAPPPASPPTPPPPPRQPLPPSASNGSGAYNE